MNKIVNRLQHPFFFILFFLIVAVNLPAQSNNELNKYGLFIIETIPTYEVSLLKHPMHQMMDVKKAIPKIILDLRYSSTENFMQKKIYPTTTTTYLRKEVITALMTVQKELNAQHWGLKIFDAYRPYAATEQMWELVKDDRYAADPRKGSGHNRGTAVDLTIIDLKTKKGLDMGTGFDNFSDTAHHDFTALPDTVLKNRFLLKAIMEKNGFKALDTEWWHYSLPNAKEYELMNLSFAQLKKICSRK